jgi:hypothetical protein
VLQLPGLSRRYGGVPGAVRNCGGDFDCASRVLLQETPGGGACGLGATAKHAIRDVSDT